MTLRRTRNEAFSEAELAEIAELERVIDGKLEINNILEMEHRVRTRRATSQRIVHELVRRYERDGWEKVDVELLGDTHHWSFRQ